MLDCRTVVQSFVTRPSETAHINNQANAFWAAFIHSAAGAGYPYELLCAWPGRGSDVPMERLMLRA